MIERLVLLLLIAGSLLFGSIVFAELKSGGPDEATVTKTGARPETEPIKHRQQGPRPEELVATILARPLFSSTRRPPENASAGPAADGDLADARLTGIVTEPGRRIAIFAVSGGKPLKVAEGDEVSGWRIDSITPREISLTGPSGTKTLQPKLDPNLVVPQAPVVNPAGRLPIPAAQGRAPAPAGGQPNATVPVNVPGISRLPRPPRPRPPR